MLSRRDTHCQLDVQGKINRIVILELSNGEGTGWGLRSEVSSINSVGQGAIVRTWIFTLSEMLVALTVTEVLYDDY